MKRVRPSRSRWYSSAIGSLTLSTMSTLPHTSSASSRIVAPAATYSSSGICEPSTGAASATKTSCPCWVSSCAPTGVSATRYSWFLTSLGTPTFTLYTPHCTVIGLTRTWGRRRNYSSRAPARAQAPGLREQHGEHQSGASLTRPARTASYRSANGAQNSVMSASSCCGSKSPRPAWVRSRGEEEVQDRSVADARRGVRRRRAWVHVLGPQPRLLPQLPPGDGQRVLPRARRTGRRAARRTGRPAAWRYCAQQAHPARASSTASTTAAPGCSSTSRRKSPRRCPGGVHPSRAGPAPSRRGTGPRWRRPASVAGDVARAGG